jgi:hypothetical protein
MTKLRVLVLCFHSFTDNFIVTLLGNAITTWTELILFPQWRTLQTIFSQLTWVTDCCDGQQSSHSASQIWRHNPDLLFSRAWRILKSNLQSVRENRELKSEDLEPERIENVFRKKVPVTGNTDSCRPLHPFGSALDIIVIQQENGSFKSSALKVLVCEVWEAPEAFSSEGTRLLTWLWIAIMSFPNVSRCKRSLLS